MVKVQSAKKWFHVLAAAMLVLVMVCFVDIFSIVSQASTGKANANAKIRKEASTNSTAVGSVTKGASIEISGETKGSDGKVWYQVTVDGTSGYIRSDLVDVTDTSTGGEGNAATSQNTNPDGVEQVNPVAAKISGGNTVRVRTSASTENSNNILTTVANGTDVTVVARTTGTDKKLWYQVKLTVNGKEVIGYIRNDYLTISGEVTPLTEETVNPPQENTTPVDNTPQENNGNTDVITPTKRYETKLMNDKWYILDYEENKQYDIDQIFTATKDYEERYTKELEKNKSIRTWLVVFAILAMAGCASAGYLFYRYKELKDAEFISNIENNVSRRTAERPKNGTRSSAQQSGREKPAIKDGMEPRREERGTQNGQRQTGNRAQQNAQRQAAAQGQSAQRQNSAQPQQGRGNGGQAQQTAQRAGAGQAQGAQRQAAGQPQQRPAGAPVQQNSQRSVNAQSQQAAQRPQNAQPQQTAQRTQPQQAQQPQNRAKNFAQEDDKEFEFLNWDSDDE